MAKVKLYTAKEVRNELVNEESAPSEVINMMNGILQWGFKQKTIVKRMENGDGKMRLTRAEINRFKKMIED